MCYYNMFCTFCYGIFFYYFLPSIDVNNPEGFKKYATPYSWRSRKE